MSSPSIFSIGAILSLQTLCTCVISTIGQYIYAFYLQAYYFPSNGTENSTTLSSFYSVKNLTTCTQGDVSPDNDAQAWAQQRSADLFFWTNLFSACPVIVTTYLLGLYTSKLGRRLVLILPMLGTAGQFGIWLSIIYFRLPEYWWYIAAVIIGLSGSNGVLSRVSTGQRIRSTTDRL
jgi:MFS family permease